MSHSRRLALSATVGVVAAAATVGVAAAGHAAVAQSSFTTSAGGAYVTLTPHVGVVGHTVSVRTAVMGKVSAKTTALAEADLGSYRVLVDGKVIGGADQGDLTCDAKNPLLPVQFSEGSVSALLGTGQHTVKVVNTFCGTDGAFHTATATRSVVVGPTAAQPPTPSPVTTRVGVTG